MKVQPMKKASSIGGETSMRQKSRIAEMQHAFELHECEGLAKVHDCKKITKRSRSKRPYTKESRIFKNKIEVWSLPDFDLVLENPAWQTASKSLGKGSASRHGNHFLEVEACCEGQAELVQRLSSSEALEDVLRARENSEGFGTARRIFSADRCTCASRD